MKKRGLVEGTEISLLLHSDNCPIMCLDAVEIHLKKLIESAL